VPSEPRPNPTTTKPAPAPAEEPDITPEDKHEMVAVAAYFLAERRGFVPGRELDDWREAAAAIERMLHDMGKPSRAGLRNALRVWVDGHCANVVSAEHRERDG